MFTLGSVRYKLGLNLGTIVKCLHWVVMGTSLGWVLGGKVLARVISVYTGLCWVHVWVESWVVKFWHKYSVFTLGYIGYRFGLCLGWKKFGMSIQCLHWVMLGTSLGWVFGGKVLAQVISVYTGLCLVHIWVESWVVKFWYERSVFTLGGVGYKFGLSLWW